MELPKMKKMGQGGMFDGIKAKLGFANTSEESYDDEYFDEDADYGEYGADYKEEPISSRYEPHSSVSTRPARSGSRASRSSDSEFPKLVSIDDVRARTQVPDSLNRDPLPPRRVSGTAASGYRSDRTVLTASAPAPSSPAHTAAARRERAEGVDSLFTSTENESGGSSTLGAGKDGGSSPMLSTSTAVSSAFDPYDAYSGTGAAKHNPSRSLSVLKPSSYGEVEYVTKILKAGDVAVLSLRNTPDLLAKRILDFSFGVSSALDASVDCVADKVFAITRGTSLTDAERTALRNQGVL